MSPFIFAFIAALLCGPLTDYVAKRFSEANNGPYEFYLLISANLIFLQGVFEPEFRLVLVSFYAFFGSMGFFGWGYVPILPSVIDIA